MVKRAKPDPVRKPPPPPAEDGSEEPFFDTSNAADFYSNLAVSIIGLITLVYYSDRKITIQSFLRFSIDVT